MPTAARARAGASLMPSPTKAVRTWSGRGAVRSACWSPSPPWAGGRGCRLARATHSAFCAGSSSGVDLGQRQLLGDGLRHRLRGRRSAARWARCPGRAGRPAPRRPPAAAGRAPRWRRARRRPAPPAATSAPPRRADPAARPPRRGRRCPARRAAAGCRRRPPSRPTVAVTPAPGWAWKSSIAVQRAGCAGGPRRTISRASGCSLRLLRRCRGRGARSSAVTAERQHVAEFELALGEGAGLVEGERGDAGQPLQRRAALDEHARAGEPAERRDDRRRASPGSAGTGTPPPAPPAPGTPPPAPPTRG